MEFGEKQYETNTNFNLSTEKFLLIEGSYYGLFRR
jgi:hypothetical protein